MKFILCNLKHPINFLNHLGDYTNNLSETQFFKKIRALNE